MNAANPTAELLFGREDATPMSTDSTTIKDWATALHQLKGAPKVWLSTVRPDGRPHAMPVLIAAAGDADMITEETT